ncbi:MAG: phosphatidate cytidylyltransferase [Longimicrobiales bacterium]|nr:phosphatidate cytidylyltransferase [Longimicrobiales bacterium]
MNPLRHISDLLGLGPGPTGVLLGLGAALSLATVLRAGRLMLRPTQTARKRWRSVGTWWVLLAVFVAMLALGRPAVAVVMILASGLALREALAIATPGHRLLALALAALGPGFVVAVAWLPGPETLPATELGWLVLLLVLTELNDIAQAFWGRTLGRLPLAPVLSPRKTWEGFWGGVLTTTAASVAVAPYLTDYGRGVPPVAGSLASAPSWIWSALLGLLVAVAGVAGDLLASRLKRRAGVEDSGRLLPGQGGILDRLDSLTVTAPTFFVLTWLLWIRP